MARLSRACSSLSREAMLVETLREEHFAAGHLPGAIHIHYEQVEERAADLLAGLALEVEKAAAL